MGAGDTKAIADEANLKCGGLFTNASIYQTHFQSAIVKVVVGSKQTFYAHEEIFSSVLEYLYSEESFLAYMVLDLKMRILCGPLAGVDFLTVASYLLRNSYDSDGSLGTFLSSFVTGIPKQA
ncbi:uncharacterized protein H6S33_001545 [Morchella sextelata]|uniref:uncharacterized protein n=1 Tax=Morchella sextelata TaxID=1174677 RepID=UPI001D046FC0|nr:uncharacterized protein H6S33_001545 [Morchella sextelata]KAH0608411.1 hypothetical protein H6S33_001545 [Morchella sextelata]